MRHVLILAPLALALAAESQAQESALVVKTADPSVVYGAMDSFGGGGELPELADGSHFVISLDDGGAPAVTTAEGDSGFLWIEARPAMLLDVFADKVGEARMMAGMMGGMMGAQAGLDPSDTNAAIAAAFGFPKQIDRLTITLPENPSESQSIKAQVSITPAADTWLQTLVTALRPHQNGVRSIAQPMDMVAVDTCIDMASALEPMKPILAVVNRMGTKSKADREAAAELMMTSYEAMDGTMSFVMDPAAGFRTLSGLRNPDAYASLWSNEDFLRIQTVKNEQNGMAEVKLDADAAEYRGSKIAKMVVAMDNPMAGPNPLANDDGEMTTWFATANGYAVMAMGEDDGAVKGAIDFATDEEAKRKKLPNGTLMQARVRMLDLMDWMSEMGGGLPMGGGDEMPESVHVDVKKQGASLVIEVDSK